MPDVHVSVNEFLSNCDSWDTQKIITALKEDGHITDDTDYYITGYDENAYEIALKKLTGKWNCLSSVEEEIILKIANRF